MCVKPGDVSLFRALHPCGYLQCSTRMLWRGNQINSDTKLGQDLIGGFRTIHTWAMGKKLSASVSLTYCSHDSIEDELLEQGVFFKLWFALQHSS